MKTYKRPRPYKPIHAGNILKDELEYRRIKPSDFAARTGIQSNALNEIFRGKHPINEQLAITIGEQFGTSGNEWINLQRLYDEDIVI